MGLLSADSSTSIVVTDDWNDFASVTLPTQLELTVQTVTYANDQFISLGAVGGLGTSQLGMQIGLKSIHHQKELRGIRIQRD